MSEYLAIKNWEKFQPGRSTKASGWVKDYTDKDSDRAYMTLTGFQRYILDGCCRLRGKSGRDLPNDHDYIARALQIIPKERHCVPQAIRVLTARGFLVLTPQPPNNTLHKNKEEEIREREEEDAQSLPYIALAQKVANDCLLPRNPGMLQAIAGAIEFCVHPCDAPERSRNQAVNFILVEVKAEIARGRPPNKFWFDDRKWIKALPVTGKSKLQESLDVIDKMEF